MVESYRVIKALETQLNESMTERLDTLEPPGEAFKRILASASQAVLFIRTAYEVEFLKSGETSTSTNFGTGFVVGELGLAMTAQHVLFPWRYDRKLLVLGKLGLARVVEDSVRWTVWPAGAQVMRDQSDATSFMEETAYSSVGDKVAARLIFVPEPRGVLQLVDSPIGTVEVSMPRPGPSDAAVFQLLDFARVWPHLVVSEGPAGVEALDEILAVGYPFSRLQSGYAVAQGVRGFVRRPMEDLLEVDVPLHPGLSGGPILDSRHVVVGLVSATLGSEVYGVAVRSRVLQELLGAAREAVRAEEARLAAVGCDPGAIDGVFDARTGDAYRCETKEQ